MARSGTCGRFSVPRSPQPVALQKVWISRKLLHPMGEVAAMELLLDRLKVTKTNNEFFDAMKR